MNLSISLRKHLISEKHHVISDRDQKMFHSQNWLLPFSPSIDKYYSPYFSDSSFKIAFLLSFDNNGKPRLYGKLASQYSSDVFHFYFVIGNPTGKKASFTFKWEFNIKNQCNFYSIYNFKRKDIIRNNQWLNEDGELNIYFEISHKTLCTAKMQPLQKRILTLKKKKQSFCGLVNGRNICYMNSVLQILFHIPEFLRILYSFDASNDDKKEILKNTQYLFYTMQNSSLPCDCLDLHDKIKFCTIDRGKQKDAHEFLLTYMGDLCKEIKNSCQEEKLNGLFSVYFNSHIEGKTGGFANVVHQKDICLDLSMTPKQENVKLIDLIYGYQSKSVVKKYLTDDKKEIDVEKWYEIVGLPPILAIHLMRGLFGAFKIETQVVFGEELDLTEFTHDENDVYEIYSILVHEKKNNGGHFYSYVRDFGSESWYVFNDSISAKCESPLKSPWISKLAYFMFYVRKSDRVRLFEKNEAIPANVVSYLSEMKKMKAREAYLRDASTFHFILEEDLNNKRSIQESVFSKKTLKIHNSKSQFDLYKEVSNLFEKKVDEIRLWLIDNSTKTIIDKSIKKYVRNIEKKVIFVQNKSQDENIIPFIENDNFEDFSCIIIFLKFFDPRLNLPIRYIGPLIVEEESHIDLPQIRTLLDFPSETKLHFFREITPIFVKHLSPFDTFHSAQLSNGSVMIVQVDDCDENLPDLSKSSVLKDVELVKPVSSLDSGFDDSLSFVCMNIKSYNAADILTNVNKNLLSHFLAFKYSMNNFYIYDYENQKIPDFSLELPSSFSLKDLRKIIQKVNKLYDIRSIWLFDKCSVSDEATYNVMTKKTFENKINDKNFPGNKIYYLYRPGVTHFDDKYIYNVQIAEDGYNVSYSTIVVAPLKTNPAQILTIAKESKNFPEIDIPNAVTLISSQIEYEPNLCKASYAPDDESCISIKPPKMTKPPASYSILSSTNDLLKIGYDSYLATPEKTNFRSFEVDNFKITQTFEMNDRIKMNSHTIRFCKYIRPRQFEVAVQVSQVRVVKNKFEKLIFNYLYEPFFINLKKTLTVKKFKEKVLKNVKIGDKEAFMRTKLEVLKKFCSEESSGEYLTKDEDVIEDLSENSLIFVVYG